MRNYDQPVAFERPGNGSAEAAVVLKKGQGPLQQRPDTHLVELKDVRSSSIEHLAAADKLLALFIPLGGWLQLSGIRVVIDYGEAGACRAIRQAWLPVDIHFIEGRRG